MRYRDGAFGPLPTIGDDKRRGIDHVLVYCQANHFRCPHSGRVTFERIALPDDVAIIRIGRWRNFRCTFCGARNQIDIRGGSPTRPAHWPTWA